MVYNVKFPDSDIKQYEANVTAMKILSQVEYYGHILKTLDGIDYYKRDDSAVSKENAFITTNRGFRKMRRMKIAWKYLIQWKDATKTWMPFNILKESNPVEVKKFVVARGIKDEPIFSW